MKSGEREDLGDPQDEEIPLPDRHDAHVRIAASMLVVNDSGVQRIVGSLLHFL